MVIGIPKEIKNNEFRVGATPNFAKSLINQGHEVYVQKGAGIGSGFEDCEYETIGVKILDDVKSIYQKSNLIIKVKEPLEEEYPLIKPNQVVFTYFHFASSKKLTEAMIKSGAVCIAYETITDDSGGLPLLTPMSEIAGKLATQQGSYFLEKPQGGRGVLIGGVDGKQIGNVTVIGAGIVGKNAALIAAGMGANVELLDINEKVLQKVASNLPHNINTVLSTPDALKKSLQKADLIIGAVLVPGAIAPKVISKSNLKNLKKGAVLVDVAIDQGGCFETSKVTTHENPIYEIDGIIHYCVANIPGAVPVTATKALTDVSLKYALEIANKGWEKATQENPHLKNGLNIAGGKVYYAAIIE